MNDIHMFTELPPTITVRHGTNPFRVPEPRPPFDIAAMLNTEKFSDVLVICGNNKYFAHKSILGARSKVFSDLLLEYENVKPRLNIEITDLRPVVCYEMLKFIYGGEMHGLPELSDELMKAADTYALPGLKLMCEKSIMSNLKVENAIDSLILADKHRSEELKTKILAFVIANAREVVGTPGYRQIAENQQSQMLADVFRVLAAHNQ